MEIAKLMRLAPVIPVLQVTDLTHAKPLAQALVAGGLSVLEVTLRTPVAWQVIEAMQSVPGAVIGVGTVTRMEHIQQAQQAGVEFIVMPGCTQPLLAATQASGIATLPGVMTPSDIMTAQAQGYSHVKFFPAEVAGGVATLRAFSGPFSDVQFCPTGGISAANMTDYLTLPNVLCVGGSWVAPNDLIIQGRWDEVSQLAATACEQAKSGTAI